MYYATVNGKRLSTERPVYVKKQENGVFIICGENDGEGVILEGEIYHINGRPEIGKPTINFLWEDDIKKLVDSIGDGAGGGSDYGAAIKSAVRLSKILLAQSMNDLKNSEIISCEALIDEWTPGVYSTGSVKTYSGQVWKCCQAHNSLVNNPDIIPGSAAGAAFWAPYHSAALETAKAWVKPAGAHDIYKAGEYMIYTDGAAYKCKSDTNFSPAEYKQAWEKQ